MEKVLYAEASYSEEEINSVLEVLKNNRLSLMGGGKVRELENKIASLYNKNYGLMVNSGSSANLIAMLSLQLKEGSKVITPSLTFSTTVSPIVQSKLIPYFVDVEKETLQINVKRLKEIDLADVSAILVPNLIGNIANWEEIYNFAQENNLKVIEDSADTIGYEYETSLKNWSDITTTSFYASHVITGAGFGGMTTYKDFNNYELGLSLRGWGRRSCLYGETEDFERRFNVKKFIYASSSSVYGGNKVLPFSVKDRVDNPVSLYAASKKSAELLAECYSHLFKINCISSYFE